MSSTTHHPSIKPYLLRAFFEWCCDNAYTPYLVIFVDEHVDVPHQYVRDQKITLNISDVACKHLSIDHQWVCTLTRFAGVSHDIHIPIGHVLSIFAKETGQAMAFDLEESTERTSSLKRRPTLTSIKGHASEALTIDSSNDDHVPPSNKSGFQPTVLHIVK